MGMLSVHKFEFHHEIVHKPLSGWSKPFLRSLPKDAAAQHSCAQLPILARGDAALHTARMRRPPVVTCVTPLLVLLGLVRAAAGLGPSAPHHSLQTMRLRRGAEVGKGDLCWQRRRALHFSSRFPC